MPTPDNSAQPNKETAPDPQAKPKSPPPQPPFTNPAIPKHHLPSPTPKFYKCSPIPTRRTPTLNAIAPHAPDPTQAAHRAENLADRLELRDLGMALARAAAARALAAHEQTLTPQDQTQRTAKSPTPEPQQPTPKPADPDLAFARHSRSVRQSVELWEKITNNSFARSPRQTWSEPSYPDLDPDLDDALYDYEPPLFSEGDAGNLYEAVSNLARLSPAHDAAPETLLEVIEETLTAHPDDHLSANFARICEIFGLTPDRSLLQPHLESQLRPPPDGYPKLE